MAPHDASTPVESPDSPDGQTLPLDNVDPTTSTASTVENPLNDVDFNLELINDEFVCTVDVTGLGIPDMDIVLDLPEGWLDMAMDTETILETFLEWEIPIILAALQDQN